MPDQPPAGIPGSPPGDAPSLDRPALRALDLQRAEQGGQPGIVLVDRLGISPELAFVPEGLLPLVARFDGRHTVAEIRAEVEAASGQTLPEGFVEGLVRQLDERLLLVSPAFAAAVREASDAFLAGDSRPARHAGSAGYPAEPGPLREALTSMVGRPRRGAQPTPRGLIAPHIDLARGREGYAQAYGYLADSEPADLYVVFGTGHSGPTAPVTGLSLDWSTPIGSLTTDRAFVAAVHERLGGPDRSDQLLHRDEHSLEFAMLFLAHLFPEDSLQVAGFLTGSLPEGDPGEAGSVADLLAAFRDAGAGRRVCYVASADLAHLGPFFGDAEPIEGERLARLEREERRRLAQLEGGSPDDFHREVMAAGNPDRVCGATPIYLAAHLAGGRGELLHYGQAPAVDGSQVVSFCSVAFG